MSGLARAKEVQNREPNVSSVALFVVLWSVSVHVETSREELIPFSNLFFLLVLSSPFINI